MSIRREGTGLYPSRYITPPSHYSLFSSVALLLVGRVVHQLGQAGVDRLTRIFTSQPAP